MWVVMSEDWGVGRALDVTGQDLADIETAIAHARTGDRKPRYVTGTFLGDSAPTRVNVAGLSGVRLVQE
jgi:hypothetical protein